MKRKRCRTPHSSPQCIDMLKVLENDKERNKKIQDRRSLPKRDFKDYISRWPKTSSFYNNIKLVTQYTDCPRGLLSMPQWLFLGHFCP